MTTKKKASAKETKNEIDIKEVENDPATYANSISTAKLVKTLKYLAEAYYNEEPLVSDEIYDILKNILEEKDPDNKFLTTVGAPVDQESVKLPYWMGSLDKIKPSTDVVDKWKKKYKGPYILSDKLDGISGLLTKIGDEIRLFTRGDGTYGKEKTHLIQYVITDKMLGAIKKYKGDLAVRGEFIMPRKKFQKYAKDFKNSRNLVGGIVNAKQLNKERIKIAKDIQFVTYEFIEPEMLPLKQFQELTKLGLYVVENKTVKAVSNDILNEYLDKRRKESLYDIDGIVVTDNNEHERAKDQNPKYSFAFKSIISENIAETTITDVIWNISPYEYLKPKIQIVPVTMADVTVTFATAHNARFVFTNNLGVGAVIKIIRSGEVIPKIIDVIKPAPSGKPKMPTVPYKWIESEADIVLDMDKVDDDDPILIELAKRKLEQFFAIIEVKNLSEGYIDKLYDAGFDTANKIISATAEELTKAERMGIKLATKIVAHIKTSLENLTLAKIMYASLVFGRGFGLKRIQAILDQYPDIVQSKKKTAEITEQIKEIDGFDDITAGQFASHLDDFRKFLKEFSKVYDTKKLFKVVEKEKPVSNKLEGQTIVFTGFRDKELEKVIIANGGKVGSSVSSNTSILLYADGGKGSSKVQKAKDKGVKIMTADEFKKEFKF